MAYLDRLKGDRSWSGHLTLESFDLVVDRLRRMIGDGQPYTWVAVNEGRRYKPEVRTGQKASKIHANRKPLDDGKPWAHFFVADTYGSWGLHTRESDSEVRDLPTREQVYLDFERDQLTISHHAPVGSRLYWVVALESGEA